MIPLHLIDKSWTLFLDRDGVINIEKYKAYINSWDEFIFYDDALKALTLCTKKFGRIIVVTNQKGVGKGITQLEDLHQIHNNMKRKVADAGGKIDAVYFSPDLEDDHPNRKPQPGMGLQAMEQFSDIDPKKSVMIGNNLSDMAFGKNLGTYTVLLWTTSPKLEALPATVDMQMESLAQFAQTLVAGNL